MPPIHILCCSVHEYKDSKLIFNCANFIPFFLKSSFFQKEVLKVVELLSELKLEDRLEIRRIQVRKPIIENSSHFFLSSLGFELNF